MANFEDILNKPADDIVPPSPLPVGTYTCLIDGLPEVKELGKNQNPAMQLKLKIISPGADVDPAALADYGNWQGIIRNHTLWLTEDAMWRAKEFFQDHVGLTFTNLREAMNAAPNQQVGVTIKHRTSQDGKRILDEIASTHRV